MNTASHSAFSLRAITLLLCASCWGCPTAHAQGLTNTIPRDQPPLARVFAPTVAGQMPTGTGKFVIFTREATGKPDEWDFIAGAWECIPSRPGVPITKRVEFCHSSWEATLLFDTLVPDDAEGLFPRFVTLMVDVGDRNYRENLYDINYRTWQVRCLWQGERVGAFGAIKDAIFCQSPEGWFRLDAVSGAITRSVPFVPLGVDGAYWLVRKPGEVSGAWSYERATERFVSHFSEVDLADTAHGESRLSADGRNRAWILVPKPKDWREVALLGGTFILQRAGHAADIRVPVTLLTRPLRGGGRLLPVDSHLGFITDRAVEFSACQRPGAKQEQVWSIAFATGEITESMRPHIAPPEETYAVFDGVSAADYLRPYLKELWHFGRGGLALAFLLHVGVLKQQPEFPECTAGVSRDGRHILYKAKEGPLADVFIYGDTQTQQIVRWPRPAEIKRGDSLEFAWVETP
jgi:hypothetical protein